MKMFKKIISVLVFIILLSTSYAKDCGDGIDCECGDNLVSGKELSFLDSLDRCMGTALTINTDNVRLKCLDEEIKGIDKRFGSSGIIINAKNVTIENCNITGFYNAIEIKNSVGGKILNNTLYFNFASGIEMNGSSNYTILENKIYNNSWDGIFLFNSNGNVIVNNTIVRNKVDGIQIYHGSYDNTVSENNLIENDGHAIAPTQCRNNVEDMTNLGGEGKPIKYVANNNNIEIKNTEEFSEIVFCNVNNSKIKNIKINNGKFKTDGILLVDSNNNKIENSYLINVRAGVYLYNSKDNMIESNIIENSNFGFRGMEKSENNIFKNNNLNNNEIFVLMENSLNNKLNHNNFDFRTLDVEYTSDFSIYRNKNNKLETKGDVNLKEGLDVFNFYAFAISMGVFILLIIIIHIIIKKKNK